MALLCDKIKKEYDQDWGVSYIDKVFNNQFYHGVMVVKGKSYPHKYPPIIDLALFEQVQKIKKGFNKKKFKYAGRPYIYRGLLRCADCGLAITPEKHKGFVYYHCTQYNGKHGAAWLREEEITRQLERVFKNLKMPKEIAEQVMETLVELHKNKVEFQTQQFDNLTREQKTLTKMTDNLYLDKLKGRITDSEYDRFYQTFRDQLTDISIRLEQLQEAEDNYYITTKSLLKIANEAHDLFVSSEVEEKRQLIKFILSNLTVKGENIDYIAQTPFDLILKCSEDQVWRP